ncbi:MAG: RluA family pseudouridine synthase, partial [Bdellovibrionales bacterium]|nr:RluA family pseudouridine synthase [Bdellovibrionales bacterium]
SGLVVHPSAGHITDTLVNALIFHNKTLSVGLDANRPGIVHRLDKDTSGLIVIAKTDLALQHLAQQFQSKSAFRIYRALVYGTPKSEVGTLTSFIGRHPTDRKKMASLKSRPEESQKGKKAITHYATLESHASGITLIECRLETGRTHQIRVHLSDIQHQILGDPIYGGINRSKNLKSMALRQEVKKLERVALHAAFLGLIHPRTEEALFFQAPWPDDLLALTTTLGFSKYDSLPVSK